MLYHFVERITHVTFGTAIMTSSVFVVPLQRVYRRNLNRRIHFDMSQISNIEEELALLQQEYEETQRDIRTSKEHPEHNKRFLRRLKKKARRLEKIIRKKKNDKIHLALQVVCISLHSGCGKNQVLLQSCLKYCTFNKI